MRRLFAVCALAVGSALLAPAGAVAAERTLTFTSKPIQLGPFAVVRGTTAVPAPGVDGYLVGMTADLVDPAGNVVPYTRVMLHHVVFSNILHQDLTCPTPTDFAGRRAPVPVERFWAESEERTPLALPAGYGYPTTTRDIWGLLFMLMNHHARAETVKVRYTVRVVTGETLAAVRPLWLDVRNCEADPIFNVPGTGGPGSTYSQRYDYRLPQSGRIVYGAGHLHGGAEAAELTLPGSPCASGVAFASVPTWGGVPPPVPLMHEPGPTFMSRLERTIPVRAGDTVRLRAVYDDSFPHVRVMGIMLAYFAPGTVDCTHPLAPQPFTLHLPPRSHIPLLRAPTGPVYRNLRSTWVGDNAFGAQRVSLRRGATFTWRFVGRSDHDATLASGPVGFASASTTTGAYRFRFAKKGTYKLYCSLHPSQMTQVITVR